ncbi:MAG TPA: carboxynorspermidine decarboxylase [Ilumatobacteraceae bacterium]|nr:carboxynorspermidine decarboxylase [Ilumatobacteraceae bacterium]
MSELRTPYYLIDEARLVQNLEVVRRVRESSGAKSLLALKCFSTWSVFPLMREYMDGTTSSSLFEARLGHERFGGETHAYSVAYSEADVAAVATFADKVIFNSVSQLERFAPLVAHLPVGLRVNPGVSHSHFDLADPARRHSRLGELDIDVVRSVLDRISGVMFHFNCENDDFASFATLLDAIGQRYADVLARLDWVSLGGGIAFTAPGYPVDELCALLTGFAASHGVQVYLEPGEAAITHAGELVTTVLDVVHNEIDVAIVDASIEAHMLDHLIYATTPRLNAPGPGAHPVIIAGRTCLAGDAFGEHRLAARLQVGDEVRIADAAGYTMVKKSWFNGVAMPSIAVRRLDGTIDVVRQFGYDDFESSLS